MDDTHSSESGRPVVVALNAGGFGRTLVEWLRVVVRREGGEPPS